MFINIVHLFIIVIFQKKINVIKKYDFRDYTNTTTAQLSVDGFDVNVNTSNLRVLANLRMDLSAYQSTTYYYGQYRYLDINLKYRVFAWNGTAALFWDWQNNTFNEPNPPDNGWKYKKITIPDDKGFNRISYQAEFDAEYSSRIGPTGSSSGYTIWAEFEIVWRKFDWFSGLYQDFNIPFWPLTIVPYGIE